MDFGTLLHVAKKNSENINCGQGKYYSTKFSAPKKEIKEKTLSDNIKKFLEKKEQEERLKVQNEKEKKEKLLAMRDEKSKNKIRKMLKVIKSANKSVLEDAVDAANTAVTLQGPDQPDEDDYGYVSQEAAVLYKKYMDKVKAVPDDKKFTPSRPQSKNDLSGTKDRVKAAIRREQQEKNNPIRVKSAKTSLDCLSSPGMPLTSKMTPSTSHRKKDLYDPQAASELEEQRRKEDEQKKSKYKKSVAAPLDFKDLLKLAEKKQHEPVEVFVEPKKEPERLLTKKEKREIEEKQKYLVERERRKKESVQNAGKVTQNDTIPKVEAKNSLATKKNLTEKITNLSSTQKVVINGMKEIIKKPSTTDPICSHKMSISKSKINNYDQKNVSVYNLKTRPPEGGSSNSTAVHHKSSMTLNSNGLKSTSNIQSSAPRTTDSNLKSTSALSLKSCDGAPRQFISKDIQINQKNFIINRKDLKTRKASVPVQKTKQFPNARNPERLKKPMKRRIFDDDDEYDSELDDFIDDGPEDDQTYSNYIKEIFGYDKSRYRDVEEDDDAMESTFAQQMKEEYLSKKIGLMEDLEDMRLEAEEKKKKILIKKRKLK